MSTTLRSALTGLFDDAGLFPPARRPMAAALMAHDRAREGPHGAFMGPFLCPVARLEELDACVAAGRPRPDEIGVVAYPNDLWVKRAVSHPGVVHIEAPLDMPLPDEAGRVRRYLELPPQCDVNVAVDAVVRARAFAKLRCGGVTPDAVPSVNRLAHALAACAGRGVSLKATAGLHHPFPRHDAATGAIQHGFVNLLAAASSAVAGATLEELAEILSLREDDGDGVVARVDRRARELVVAIGTCSIDEPVDALEDLGVL